MANIKLSPKHGVNPTIPVCAWCGEPKNEIALLGKLNREDSEAPMHCVLDYVPCEHCAEQWSIGVAILEATTKRPEPYRPPMQKDKGNDIYPTMRMVVINPESASEIFGQEMKAGQRILLEDEAFEQIFGEALREREKLLKEGAEAEAKKAFYED